MDADSPLKTRLLKCRGRRLRLSSEEDDQPQQYGRQDKAHTPSDCAQQQICNTSCVQDEQPSSQQVSRKSTLTRGNARLGPGETRQRQRKTSEGTKGDGKGDEQPLAKPSSTEVNQ